MLKLTPRQQEILDFIRQFILKTGLPPTRAEIAKALGFRSPNAAEDHLKALVKKGAITVLAGTSRGIRINADFEGSPSPLTLAEQGQTVMEQISQTLSPSLGSSLGSSLSSSLSPSSAQAGSQETILNQEQVTAKRAANPVSAVADRMLSGLVEGVTQVIESLSLPVVGRVAAGNPILAEENLDTTLQLDPALFSSRPDYLLRVKGESMRDVGIMDGDLLAVKRQAEARNGQIIVARIDEEVTVKRFVKTKQHIELLPENNEFEPIIVTSDRHFSIEGIAVGLIRQQQYH